MSSTLSFYKDPANAKVMGVCAGIAHTLNVDPLWVRIGTIVLTFVTNFLLLPVYVLLGILLPALPDSKRFARRAGKEAEAARTIIRAEPSPAKPVNKPGITDPIDYELERMKAERFEEELARTPEPTRFGDVPKTLEGDTSRKSGRTLEGVPANKRKV